MVESKIAVISQLKLNILYILQFCIDQYPSVLYREQVEYSFHAYRLIT